MNPGPTLALLLPVLHVKPKTLTHVKTLKRGKANQNQDEVNANQPQQRSPCKPGTTELVFCAHHSAEEIASKMMIA